MPVRATVSTKGLEGLLEALAKKGANLDAVAGQAVQAAGDVMLAEMQGRVPVDTGNLKDTLAVDGPHQSGNYTYVEVGIPRSADAETVRYGTVQEYGSARTPAKSYIRAAGETKKSAARKAMIDVLKGAL